MIITPPVKIIKCLAEFTQQIGSFIKKCVCKLIEYVSAIKSINEFFEIFKLVIINNFYWIILNSTKNESHSANVGTRVVFYKLDNPSYL